MADTFSSLILINYIHIHTFTKQILNKFIELFVREIKTSDNLLTKFFILQPKFVNYISYLI